MKITMLGTTGSGKTTYLSSLLSNLYEGAVNGFTLRPNHSKGSEIIRYIDSINTLYSKGKFPKPTTDTEFMKLSLGMYKGNKHLVNLDFIDYRGGVLDEIARDENGLKKGEIAMAILASDVNLIFIDSIILNECKDIRKARQLLGVTPITAVLTEAKKIQKEHSTGKKTKIIFVLSKADANTISSQNITEIKKEKVRLLYSTLYSEFDDESESFKIFDICTVGRDLVSTKVEWDRTNEGITYIKTTNEIKPGNICLKPKNVVSVLAQAFIEGMDNISYNIAKLSNMLEIKSNSMKPIAHIIDILFNKSSKRYEIFSIESQLEEENDQLIKLKNYIEDLQKVIEKRE